MSERTQFFITNPQDMLREYSEQKWLFLPHFISASCALNFQMSAAPIAVRKVICGDPAIRFGEQHFENDHVIPQFFSAPEVTAFLLTLAKAGIFQRIQCWASVYQYGEYINEHKDRAGTLQLLICLQSPSDQSHGGILILKPKPDQTQMLFLKLGDAVVFEATSIPHETTPLLYPDEKRVVAVGRYYV